MRDGLTNVDQLLARRKRKGKAEAALIAIDPRTGDILAMVGGRSYNQSQYNRAIVVAAAARLGIQAVRLSDRVRAGRARGPTDVTPATLVDDSPTTWEFDDQVWTPENYEDEYDGPVTFRRRARALAQHRDDQGRAEAPATTTWPSLWRRLGVGSAPQAVSVHRARRFRGHAARNRDRVHDLSRTWESRKLRHIMSVTSGDADVTRRRRSRESVARPDTTYLVTDMLRTVLNEGTGAGARAARASRSTPPEKRARPTICAMPGSSASPLNC